MASAVTNLDLHDIARVSRTYGVRRFYVVTPLVDQQDLVARIIAHWTVGGGAEYNPLRAEAFSLISVKDTFQSMKEEIIADRGRSPAVVMTSARQQTEKTVDYSFLRRCLAREDLLLGLGTAWGLTRQCLEEADYVLEPVAGNNGYNHLSVRSAISIMLDRLINNGL